MSDIQSLTALCKLYVGPIVYFYQQKQVVQMLTEDYMHVYIHQVQSK